VRVTEILTDGKQPAEKSAGAAKPAAKPKERAERARPQEPEAGERLFEAPSGKADDLKVISGVGPVLEKKLNDAGITRFDQIAGFSADDVARVDEALHLGGRIERDDWVGQAKALAAEAAKEK
jgi:large subunit ribosomal protein L21